MTTRFQSLIAAFVIVFAGQSTPATSQDADVAPTLTAAIQSMGDEIAKYVTAQNNASAQVAVGTFVGPGPQSSNAGVRIVVALREHLKGKMRIGDSGAYSITGEFRGQKLDGKFVTVIEAAIKDSLGTQLHRLRKKIITDEEEGIAFFGPTSLDLTKTKTTGAFLTSAKNKSDAIVDAIVNPKVNLDNNIIRPSAGSPYGIELLLKTSHGYESIPVVSDGRLAKAAIAENQVYAIRLHNDSREPIGVKLTIDGINVFAMSENPSYRGKDITMAMCPCSASRIKGWYLNDNHSAEFAVAKFGETAAATFGAFEKMGTITARFFSASAKGKLNCPPCEKSRSLGTKVGATTKMSYGRLDVSFGEILGAASVRYIKETPPDDLPPQ